MAMIVLCDLLTSLCELYMIFAWSEQYTLQKSPVIIISKNRSM